MSTATPKPAFHCPAFENGGAIPVTYTGDGLNVSPELAWSGFPRKTRSFSLICDDPDAPMGTWVHWLLWNLPPDVASLPESVEKIHALPAGTCAGTNDFGTTSYDGPAPPPGKPHHYFFKLYALDTPLALKPGSTKDALEKAMSGHVLAKGIWMGTYRRQ